MLLALKSYNIAPSEFKKLTRLEWESIIGLDKSITETVKSNMEREKEKEKLEAAMNAEMNKRFNR